MRALDDIRRSIVAANASDEFRIITPIALSNKDVSGPAEIRRWLAERSTRQHVLVAKGGLSINEHDLQTMPHADVLKPIIENQGVRLKLVDRINAALHAVAVREHDNAAEIVRKHERLIARRPRIQEKRNPIGHHTRNERGFVASELLQKSHGQRAGHTFITSTQNRHLASALLQRTGQHFDNRCLSRAANGEIAHTDHKDPMGMTAKNPVAV